MYFAYSKNKKKIIHAILSLIFFTYVHYQQKIAAKAAPIKHTFYWCGSLHNSSPTVPFLRIRNQRRRVHFVRLSDCKTKLRQILIDCATFVQLAREEQHMVFIFKCRRKWCRFGKAWYCYDSA